MDNQVDRHANDTPDGQAPAGENNTTNNPNNTPTNWFEDALFWVIAGLAFIFWEPTKGLFRGTYTKTRNYGDGNVVRDPNPLNITIGILISLATGIGVGYQLGWAGEAPFLTWALWGVGSAFATFIYGWTIAYQVAVRHAFKVSERLWSHVNIDAKEHHRYYRDESDTVRRNPAWFSQFLMFLSWALIVVAGAFAVYHVACLVQADQATFGWLGWIIGVLACIVLVIVAIAIIAGAASLSGKFAFFLVVVGAVVAYFFWGPVSGLFLGLFRNLTGGDWGAWGYVPGAVLGLLAGGIGGAIAGSILNALRIRLIAAVTGIAATYYLAGTTAAVASMIPLGSFAFLSPALAWLGHGIVLLLTVGFAFPIAHIFATHGLKRLANIFDLMDDVYGEKRGGYREFFLQVATIAATVLTFWFGPGVVSASIGLTSIFAAIGISVVAATIVYIALYKLLDLTGSWPFGVGAAVLAGFKGYGIYAAHGLWFGTFGAVAAGILAGLFTFVVAFPALYLALRFIIQGWLAAFLRDPLVNLHKRVCTLLGNLWDELFEAAEHAYGDTTPYREVFLHIANIAVAAGLTVGSFIAGGYLGFALWLTVVISVILTAASYVLVGRLLVRKGAAPIGFLVASAAGVLAGTFVFGAQPESWEWLRWILAVAGGLVGAALTFGGVFPWAYLIVRAIINVVAPEKWLRPFLVNTHNAVWEKCSTFWARFLVKYRAFQERFKHARERFAQSYARFTERYNQMKNRKTGGKN